MEKLFRIFKRDFIMHLILTPLFLIYDVWLMLEIVFGDAFEDLRFLVLFWIGGNIYFGVLMLKTMIPLFKDYFCYVKPSKCEKVRGTVISVQVEKVIGKRRTDIKRPVIQLAESEEQLILDVHWDTWELGKEYVFLYLKNTAMAVIEECIE